MIKRSDEKPLHYDAPPAKVETFAQKHNVMVVATRAASQGKGARTLTTRWSNEACALRTVFFLTEKGYFARIV